MSIIRRAHPDVSNEVAFVALAQSRGRASEATAVLHLPRAKDEAALVTMMLDVTAFIALAREVTERRRQARQLEKHRRMVAAQQQQAARYLRNQGHQRDSKQEQQQQLPLDHDMRQGGQQHGDEPRQYHHQPEGGGDQHGHSLGGVHGGYEWRGGDGTTAVRHASGETHRRQHQHQHQVLARIAPSDRNDGSRGESRRSGSAPSLLPPIERRLTEGTPPSPDSLKAVLSTSTSVAVEVPNGFGFTSEAERAKKGQAFVRGHGSTSSRRYESLLFGCNDRMLILIDL